MARGKYAHIVAKLPRFEGEDVGFQEKVNAVAKAIREDARNNGIRLGSAELARAFAAQRAEKERIEEELKDANLHLGAIKNLLIDQFEQEGATSIKLDNGSSVVAIYEPHAVVKDKQAFRRWCIANGYENEMVLPWITTDGLVKELLLKGEAEPEGVQATTVVKLRLNK